MLLYKEFILMINGIIDLTLYNKKLYVLIDVDLTSIIKSLDISDISSSTLNKPKFLSKEFGDFMELITKWNLSDACGSDILKFSRKICHDDVMLPTSVKQGCQVLDQINVSHISFKKVPIMEYMEETYHLNYHPIFDAIKELLINKDIFGNCTFEFEPLYCSEQRIYQEQYNSTWWQEVQESLPEDAKVLSIILYSDTTTCDHLGKSSEHPIYLTLGNIVSWR